jgi:hypothetical protein
MHPKVYGIRLGNAQRCVQYNINRTNKITLDIPFLLKFNGLLEFKMKNNLANT